MIIGGRLQLTIGLTAFALLGVAAVPASAAVPGGGGDQVWVDVFQPNQLRVDAGHIAVSRDETTVYVASNTATRIWASSARGSIHQWAIVAYDTASGTQRWVAFSPADLGSTSVYDMAIAPDGSRLFVTGYYDVPGAIQTVTVAYDAATGVVLWTSTYVGLGYGLGESIVGSPDSRSVYVVATVYGSDGPTEYATVAYDAATGQQRWDAVYLGPKNNSVGLRVAVSSDGTDVFATGFNIDFRNETVTFSYDAQTGQQEWKSTFADSPWGSDPKAIGVEPGGPLVYVGVQLGSSGADWGVLGTAGAAGGWLRRYAGPNNAQDMLSDIAVAPDGGAVYATGTSYSSSGHEAVTLAYDQRTGARLWAAPSRRCKSFAGIAQAIAVSPDSSRVYVTGAGATGGYFTIAYDATTCSKLWASAYHGPMNDDLARDITVAPSSGAMLFVTGVSYVSGGSAGPTIAYASN